MTASFDVGIVLPFDLQHDLITIAEAAELVFGWSDDPRTRRRHKNLIAKWIERGHLEAQDHNGPNGGPRVLGVDALRAEQKTRARARRTA